MTTLKAASGSLTRDAHRWEVVAEVLSQQSSNVESLNLASGELPQAGDGLEDAYSQLQTKVAELLREGNLQASAVSSTLIHVRNQLNSLDESVRDSLNGLWDL